MENELKNQSSKVPTEGDERHLGKWYTLHAGQGRGKSTTEPSNSEPC